MGSLLDILGALFIFGIVMLIALQLNVFTMEKNTQHLLRTMNQENVSGNESGVGIGTVLDMDLSRIGAADAVSPSVLLADANKITLRGDVDANGTVDSVKYFLTTPPSTPNGGNSNLKYLYRRQNAQSGTKGWVGVSSFQLSYYDNMGRTIPTPVAAGSLSSIRSIRAKVMFESAMRVKNDLDTSFAASYWETLISPMNIR
jgi:hypothetical protein